jgi:hypothetical protein
MLVEWNFQFCKLAGISIRDTQQVIPSSGYSVLSQVENLQLIQNSSKSIIVVYDLEYTDCSTKGTNQLKICIRMYKHERKLYLLNPKGIARAGYLPDWLMYEPDAGDACRRCGLVVDLGLLLHSSSSRTVVPKSDLSGGHPSRCQPVKDSEPAAERGVGEAAVEEEAERRR